GITRDHGKSWYFPETIPVAQFYQINVDEDTPFNVYGGMQDNGNWYGPAYTWKRGGIRTLYWQYLVGGDGFYIAPDQENSRFGYGTSQNGDLYRYDKVSGYYQSIAPQSPNGKTILRFNWNAGFAKDPFDSNGVYYGSQFVHKSKDKGANWKIISPDLTTNNPAYQKGDYGGLTLDISGAENYTTILSIAPSPMNQKILWAGTDDGQIQLTKDGGSSWTNITASIKGLPEEAWIARIHASKYEEGTAWIVVNNYRKGDYTPYLFRTTDYGKNWSSMVDSSQVKGYTLSFIQDPVEPKLLFLGTENGLWISSDEGQHWTQFKNGFPSVSTRDLVIQEKESALVVGTFGRALWILDDLVSLRALISSDKREPLLALPVNPTV
ncbi:MAG: WD40/YVTN/BNR-like repeat-containing protein, partial [Saprospiraceae bacterium]